MRFLALVLLLCVLASPALAWAATAYDDVPTDHWAYNALDYLTQRGVLEGYPDGFFKGDRTLTRYEFAQAIARLLDTIGKGTGDEQIRIMADTLRAEFSDQLAELAKNLQDTNNRVADLDSRMGDLEGKVGDTAAKVDDLSQKVAGLKSGLDWKGLFDYRWQADNYGDHERFRQRILINLGFNKKVTENVEAGMRLKLITGTDAVGSLFNLGSDGKTAPIYLDRAYVKYSPSWFGQYSDPECAEHNRLDLYAGIFPNITYDPRGFVLDTDLNLQGLGAVYHFNKDFQLVGAASVLVEENGTDYFSDDTYLYAAELKHNNLFINGLDAWLGYFGWQNEMILPDGSTAGEPNYFANNGADGIDFNNDGVVNGQDRFTATYTTVRGGLQYTFPCVFQRPLAVFGEYMVNIDSDAETNIAAANTALGTALEYENSDDYGFLIGAQYGADPVQKGQWNAFVRYRETGANAIVHGTGDNTTGGSNVNGLEANWTYMFADNSLVGISYYIAKMHNAYGSAIPDRMAERNTVQVDWVFKF